MAEKIPVSVLIVTRNEGPRIASCLAALLDFAEIVVIDSASADDTVAQALRAGARLENFVWNGLYPKKRQWCLDNLALKHDWVFFVDADEIVTAVLAREIAALFADGAPGRDGYFVRGHYVRDGRIMRHGLSNNKLVLFDRRRAGFPVVDDLDLPGMGEIEGHYQPVGRQGDGAFGQLRHALLHDAYADPAQWTARHRRYANWEAGMNARGAWPRDPKPWRQHLKVLFRALPCRGPVAFLHSYVWRQGFRDGKAGWRLARDRWQYYAMIRASSLESGGAARPRRRQ